MFYVLAVFSSSLKNKDNGWNNNSIIWYFYLNKWHNDIMVFIDICFYWQTKYPWTPRHCWSIFSTVLCTLFISPTSSLSSTLSLFTLKLSSLHLFQVGFICYRWSMLRCIIILLLYKLTTRIATYTYFLLVLKIYRILNDKTKRRSIVFFYARMKNAI